MLVLTRKINEIVMVGDNIQVKVLAVNGSKVLLGFNAPKIITVHRQEVYERIKRDKDKATNDSFMPN